MKQLFLILAVAMMATTAQAQTIPDVDVPTPAVQEDVFFFAGATDDDKAFIRAANRAVDNSDLRRGQKRRIKRRLKQPRFVAKAKAECLLEFKEQQYWEDPDNFNPEAVQGFIDWDNLDIEKLQAVVEIIIGLIETIIELFSSNQITLEEAVVLLNYLDFVIFEAIGC